MHEPLISFGTEQFNRIFPFYLLINSDSKVAACGKSVAKLLHIEPGTPFADNFILRSSIKKADFQALKELTGQEITLDFAAANNKSLRGRLEFLGQQNQLLFIGTPFVEPTEEINGKHLKPDQAKHDRITTTTTDIEQQKQLEHQLRINEKRYRDLFNYSQAFICTHDLQGKLLSVNPAICEKLGYTKEELIGRMITDFIPRNDLSNFRTEYMEAVTEKGSAKGIFRVQGKTDKKSFLLYQNFKVEEDGAEPYIIGFSQDITERIKIEKELRKNKKNTEEAARAKEFFLANMSHEIRTPLSGLLGIANLLSKTPLNEQQTKYTNLINSSANSLLSIVNDILDIEKIASGKFDLEHVPFKLEEKVMATVQSFQFKAEEKNVTLSFKSNVADDLVVIGDPSRLGQILNNLLSNALKFTNTGGIYVSVYYYFNDAKSTTLEFEVTDTGIGIKSEKLSDIFNPFVQATADTSRKFGGTGLGLSICKELIEMHGGSISVKSALNVGTTFSFLIPYSKGNVGMLKQENSIIPDYKSLHNSSVLVAEDWELNQFLVQYILESWGCKVTMVNNGKEALDMAKSKEFDLVLMDIHMPEMDGITATKKIRKLGDNNKASVPIIALTANALKTDHLHYLEAGMNECVTKPYTEEKLFRVISKALGHSNVHEQAAENTAEVETEFIEQSSLLYDLSFINEFAKGDTSFIKKMIKAFQESMVTELRQMIISVQAKRYHELSRSAHKMKSAIDGLGINSLKKPIRDIEAINAIPEDPEVVKTLVDKVKRILDEVFVQLDGYLKL